MHGCVFVISIESDANIDDEFARAGSFLPAECMHIRAQAHSPVYNACHCAATFRQAHVNIHCNIHRICVRLVKQRQDHPL